MNLSRIVERWADFSPRVALHFRDEHWTWRDLLARIDQHRAARSIVRKGDRVAWLGYNYPEMLVLLFALARLGAHPGAAQLPAGRARTAEHPAHAMPAVAGRGTGFSTTATNSQPHCRW